MAVRQGRAQPGSQAHPAREQREQTSHQQQGHPGGARGQGKTRYEGTAHIHTQDKSI